MGDFQQQMEGMLAEAAASAVRDRAGTMLAELRASLREEAKQVLSEASASQAGPWIEQSIKQLNKASQESARILYGQWKKKLETDVQQALERVDQRGRELEESSQSLAMKAAERVQGVLESSRKEGVGRIVARLKEQMAPSIDNALKVTSDMAKHKNELEKAVERSIEKSTERIEEIYARCEKKFESAIQEKLDAAREELEAQSKQATQLALGNLRASGQKYSAEAERHFREAFQLIVEKALGSLKEKAAETSHHFASELASYSRSHLEFVGGAISELAKGMGKAPREK
jgi:Na+/phosphate symporter